MRERHAAVVATRRIQWLGVLAFLLAGLGVAAPVSAIGLREESDLGARFALTARRSIPLVREPAVREYLRRVGLRITSRLDSGTFRYRWYVVRDAGLNAFAVPGGYVYVNAGLIEDVDDEAELAGVLAHEIVHVDAHHVVRQEQQAALANYGTLLGVLLSAVHPALGAGAIATGAAVQLKYQREFEQEADHIGLELMQRAGFDPVGMPAFLRKVLRAQRLNPTQLPPYFLSHPLTEDRVAALEQRARALPRPAPRPEGAAELAAAQVTLRALTGPPDKVIAETRARLKGDATSARAEHLLGLAYLYGGRPDDAEPLLLRAVDGGSPRARGDHGRALARLGRLAEARSEFEAHLRDYPGDAAVQSELARAVIAAGNAKGGAALLASALELDPELDEAEYALAECLGGLGDGRGQWWHLGRAYELRGDFERAIGAYERARDLSAEGSPERAAAEQARRDLLRVGRGR